MLPPSENSTLSSMRKSMKLCALSVGSPSPYVATTKNTTAVDGT